MYAIDQSRSPVFPSCTTSPFTYVRSARSVGSTSAASTSSGPDRAEPVLALHAQHRAAVGVAEVVHAEVVRRRVPGDVVERVLDRHALHPPADHHGDLALVVQVPAAARAHDLVAVSRERRRRLQEVRRIGRRLRRVLLDPARVAQVDGDDLGRREVDRARHSTRRPPSPCSRTRTRSPCRPRPARAATARRPGTRRSAARRRPPRPARSRGPRRPPRRARGAARAPSSQAGKSARVEERRRVDRRALLGEAGQRERRLGQAAVVRRRARRRSGRPARAAGPRARP